MESVFGLQSQRRRRRRLRLAQASGPHLPRTSSTHVPPSLQSLFRSIPSPSPPSSSSFRQGREGGIELNCLHPIPLQVYLTLCSALAFSALGAYLHVALNVGGTLTTIGCLAAIAFLISLPPSQDHERNRFALLMSAALLQGASVGPLLDLVLHLDPRVLVTAFVGTAIAFGCFSGAAIIAKRGEYLYLGGLLSSALSILLWLQFAASIFGHSSATFTFELYFGLLVFLGYMVFDTQEIIERAHHGDMDYIKHALTLFTDFVAVLVRGLVIMLKNAQEKSEEDKKRKKR